MSEYEPCICDTGLTCWADEHDDWEATVDGWKAEIEAMTLPELLAGFSPARAERERHDGGQA